MDSRTHFLLQLLQKLGAPLMGAVATHSQSNTPEEKDAQTMAGLLSESVKAGITLSQSMNLKTGEGDADAVRVTLATLAGQLIAEHYKSSGRMPGEVETRRMIAALQSVIVFSDNFAPAAEHAKRLETLDGQPPFFDPLQTGLYAMHALVPAISAISVFSFGQPETRLIQDVAERLGARAKDMLSRLPAETNPMSELVILQALGRLYAAAHEHETLKLRSDPNGEQSSAGGIDAVWASFDKQAGMLDILLSSMGGQAASGGSGGGVRPHIQAASPSEQPPAAPAAAPDKPANPMSFFKKK